MIEVIIFVLFLFFSLYTAKRRVKGKFLRMDILRIALFSVLFCLPFMHLILGRPCIISFIVLAFTLAYNGAYLVHEKGRLTWMNEIFFTFFFILLLAVVYGAVYLIQTV